MFDNIKIPSLESFLDQIPEQVTVIVESKSVEHRKELTRIKNDLLSDDLLIEYEYIPKRGKETASGQFVVLNADDVINRLSPELSSCIK